MIQDERKNTARPMCYVVATDEFMSGWGHAPARSLYALACYSVREQEAVMIAMNKRDEMKRPRIVSNLKKDGTPKISVHENDHLSIKDARDTDFVRGQAAFT
jgi:hypothetical protein